MFQGGGWKKEVTEKSKKLERIHEMFMRLNMSFIAPLNKDYNTGRYNYELIISILKVISREVMMKLDEDEKKKVEEHNKKIKEILLNKPVFKIYQDNSLAGRNNRVIRDMNNWNELERVLEEYDSDIREWVSNYFENVTYGEGDFEGDEGTVIVDEGDEMLGGED